MNSLAQEIVKHIFTKLGVGNELHRAYTSIIDSNFLLDRKLCLINDEDEEINNNMWSCKLTVEEKDFRLLLADCSALNDKEYALIISLQGSPEYGCYFSMTDSESSAIGCLLNGFWIPATVYMQATFLAGMEQIKDLSMPWQFNDKTDDLYEKLVEFIKHHDEAIS
jgi:hypothetical protein